MANSHNSILAITQPTISIRRISHIDIAGIKANPELKTSDFFESEPNLDFKSATGLVTPYIEIDNYIIPPNKLLSVSIDQSGFLPEITISFLETNGLFSGMYFPRTNPILKIYVKALSNSLKPIRSDYLITNVISSESASIYGADNRIESVYTVSGKLYIPGIYGNTIQSISKKKSWEAIKQIAEFLKLGFATNETSTDDEMTWINPNDTIENFIKDIASRAYKDEKSFFDCFIDTNYILNFINYEKSLSKDTSYMEVPGDATISQFSAVSSQNSLVTSENSEMETLTVPVILDSSIKKSRSGFHISHYSMHSNHGEILSQEAFRKTIIWHDRNFWKENKAPIKHFIEPLSEKTINSNLAEYQKPKLETFGTETSTRWLGLDYNNSHLNYKFARLINSHNLDELSKNYLIVKLPGLSQLIYRGGKVGVQIYRLPGTERDGFSPDEKFPQNDTANLGMTELPDVYLSGPYVVKDIKYEYNAVPEHSELRYSTELVLVRREWVEIGENNKLASEKTT